MSGGGNGRSSTASGSTFGGWPALHKAEYRGQALELQELHEGLFLVENAFTVEECRGMIAGVEATGTCLRLVPNGCTYTVGQVKLGN